MKATVYHFRWYDGTTDTVITSKLKRTAEAIEAVPIRGEILRNTAEDVDVAVLDEYGRYDPSQKGKHA